MQAGKNSPNLPPPCSTIQTPQHIVIFDNVDEPVCSVNIYCLVCAAIGEAISCPFLLIVLFLVWLK